MATVTINQTMDLLGGGRLLAVTVTGTDAYNRVTGDQVTPTQIGASANAVMTAIPSALTNGGYGVTWQNSLNAFCYYGEQNVGATGGYNGQPLLAVGNSVNLSTHTFPALILVKPG